MGLRLTQLPASLAVSLRAAVPKQDRVTVPAPPSANALWFNAKRGGRVKTPEYRAWIAAVEGTLMGLGSPESYPCEFYYILVGKWNLERDGGANVQKALEDATVSAGVIPDDSLRYVWGWHGVYAPHLGGDVPECVVWFEACGGGA